MADDNMPHSPSPFGRIYAPDPRDRRYPMTAPVDESELRRYRYFQTGPVLNQGATPTCVGMAWRQWLSSAHMMTKGGPSPFDIYHEAQKVDSWPGTDYAGTSVRAGVKVLHSLGHIETYVWARSVDDIVRWVCAEKGTVVLGTTWHLGMHRPDSSGFIHPAGQVLGGHAYLLVGWNRSRGVGRILNSWGREWGEGGRAWIQGEDLEKLLADHGEACSAVEKVVSND